MPTTPVSMTVYMNKRDITKWVTRVAVEQAPHTLYRQATVVLAGWYAIELAKRWDIYASTDLAVPRSSLLLSGAVVPPDRRPETVVAGGVPITTVTLYDWAWLAQRRTPRQTLVIAPKRELAVAEVERYLAEEDGPVGRYQIIEAPTMHAAVAALAVQAGFHVDLRIPDYAMAPLVVDPKQSLWKTIYSLVEPFQPQVFFRHNTAKVAIVDRIGRAVGVGPTLSLSATAIEALSASSLPYRNTRRVLIQVPRWR